MLGITLEYLRMDVYRSVWVYPVDLHILALNKFGQCQGTYREGTDCLPTATIFEDLERLGVLFAWQTICKKFIMSKFIFDAMVETLRMDGVKFCWFEVGLRGKLVCAQRIETFEDQESLGVLEDASKQGRSIEDIDDDVDVSLVDETQERQDDDLVFDTRVLEVVEMPVEAKVGGKDEQNIKKLDDSTTGEAVTTAGDDIVTTAATTTTITTRPKNKGVVVHKPSEFRVPQEIKPSSSKDKRDIQVVGCELLEEQKLARKQEEEANIALIESWENTQAMMEADRLPAERLQSKEREELTDEEKAKLFMELMEKKRKRKPFCCTQDMGSGRYRLVKAKRRKKDEDYSIDAIPLATINTSVVIIDYNLHKKGWLVHMNGYETDRSSKSYYFNDKDDTKGLDSEVLGWLFGG
ncbi:hypothetical protein Tco_0877536 [Tanacetum coccineum]|uniref:Uncharacterized protein n=1 Tax=Tanacetum coccineum TaxID=301880 RepID=A0ABQ5BVF3_9ASTR